MEKELGCLVISVNCPGFIGESQASGHRIAYESLLDNLIGRGKSKQSGDLDVNIIGEYNINGESSVLKSLLGKMGIKVHCIFTGDIDYERIITAHTAKLNLLVCQSTGRFLAQRMKEKYGIPYLKVSFFGLSQTRRSLYDIGKYFGIEDRAKKLASAEEGAMNSAFSYLLPRLKGKKAAMFFGASRMASLVSAIEDLGMEVLATGSQFGDADTYLETRRAVKPDTLIMDDASEQDLENMLHNLKPDVFMGGIKEQSLSHKAGIGFCLFPQIKIAGPYVGFKDFLNFAGDVHKAIYAPVWRLAREKLS
jgi:nitrogenase molybdenum-cofactor synthesis protein NifE